MSNFNETLDSKIMPAMSKLSENKIIKSIQYGAMSTMPPSLE